VTVTPDYQSGTQAQRLAYVVTVTNNDAPACGGSSFVVRPTLPAVPSGYPWTHVPEGYFSTAFVAPGASTSREISVTSASLSQMGENTIVWTASHTLYNSGSGEAIFNVIPYGAANLWKFLSPGEPEMNRYQFPWCRRVPSRWELDWLLNEPCRVEAGTERNGEASNLPKSLHNLAPTVDTLRNFFLTSTTDMLSFLQEIV
jgi:hypothetical protein